MMKLKYVVGSPNCRKVHAVIDRLGLSVDFEYLDFFTGELRSEAYTALNPNAMVPTLVDGDFTLWESNAINVYLASRQATPLYPADARARADITRWLCWELAHYNRALAALSFETVAKPVFLKMQPDTAVVEIARRDLQRFLPVLERHLRGKRYMVGDAITKDDKSPVTVADFAAQAVVAHRLAARFPEAVLVGEESAGGLKDPASRSTLEQITRFVQTVEPSATADSVCEWIDRGSNEAPATYWTLDPVDGTKGFLRKDQYAVALALVILAF